MSCSFSALKKIKNTENCICKIKNKNKLQFVYINGGKGGAHGKPYEDVHTIVLLIKN